MNPFRVWRNGMAASQSSSQLNATFVRPLPILVLGSGINLDYKSYLVRKLFACLCLIQVAELYLFLCIF